MRWLRSVRSLELQVSFAKEPYERDDILQKRPIVLRSLLVVATLQCHTVASSRLYDPLYAHAIPTLSPCNCYATFFLAVQSAVWGGFG